MQSLLRPADPARLRFFEAAFALSFACYMVSRFLHAEEWLTAAGFHYTAENYYTGEGPPFPLLPLWAANLLGLGLFLAVAALVMGLWRRAMLWAILAVAVYVNYADTAAAAALNRIYIVVFAMLATAPAPVRLPDGQMRQTIAPVRIIQAFVCVFYVGAGLSKAWHGSWLSHGDAVWHNIQGVYRTDFAAWCLAHLPMVVFYVFHWGALIFELGAPLLLGVRKLRVIGVPLGLVLHLSIALMFSTIVWFSLQMACFYILFIPEAFWRRMRVRIREVVFSNFPGAAVATVSRST